MNRFRSRYAALALLAAALISPAALAQSQQINPLMLDNAQKAMEQKEYGRAVTLFTRLIKSAPKRFHLYLFRGIAYYQQGKFDKAAGDFTSFIRLRPQLVEGYLNRSYAYNQLGRYKEALADLDTVESIDPMRVPAELRKQILDKMPAP